MRCEVRTRHPGVTQNVVIDARSVSVSGLRPLTGGLSVQLSSVVHSCPAVCNRMDCSTPGFPAHHQLPEFTQTHAH